MNRFLYIFWAGVGQIVRACLEAQGGTKLGERARPRTSDSSRGGRARRRSRSQVWFQPFVLVVESFPVRPLLHFFVVCIFIDSLIQFIRPRETRANVYLTSAELSLLLQSIKPNKIGEILGAREGYCGGSPTELDRSQQKLLPADRPPMVQ